MKICTQINSSFFLHVSLWYLLFVGMIGRYTEKGIYWFAGAIVLLVLLVTVYSKKIWKRLCRLKTITLIIAWMGLCGINILMVPDVQVLYSNIVSMSFPIVIGILLLISKLDNRFSLKKCLRRMLWIVNLWWIINLYVVSVQNTGNPLFIKQNWLSENEFYPDLCCGLFGFNGTHELAFFSCFILIVNLWYIEDCKNKLKTILAAVFLVGSESYNLLLSVGNDNKVSFVLIPAVLMIYIVLKYRWQQISFIRRSFRYAKYIIFSLVLFAVLMSIPRIRMTMEEAVFSKISRILFYRNAGSIYGGNERLAIIRDAFSQHKTWLIGVGMGASLWIEEGAHGFTHYGLNSMGSFLIQMGIWITFLHCLVYSGICCKLVNIKWSSKRKTSIVFALCLLFTIGTSAYSAIFTSYASSCWIFMMFFTLGELNDTIQGKKNGRRYLIHES